MSTAKRGRQSTPPPTDQAVARGTAGSANAPAPPNAQRSKSVGSNPLPITVTAVAEMPELLDGKIRETEGIEM